MLRRTERLFGYKIQAKDAEVGEVEDFYFDDAYWIVRYLVVETGGWLEQERTLLAPHSLGEPNWLAGILPVDLTAEQIKTSPPTDWNKPISREHEFELHTHYGWEYYRLSLESPVPLEEMDVLEDRALPVDTGGPHLRSAKAVTDYNVQATDGKVGRLSDMLVDDETWTLRYLVVDTRGWLPGRQVLVASPWVEEVDWTHATIHLDVTQEMLESSPEYEPRAPITREYEESLHDYYARPNYSI